jgi:hypothetical protein
MMTMTWRVVGTVLVITETVDTPSDAEWNAFIRDTIQYRRQVDEMRVLINTDGGGPNAAQRSLIKGAIGGKQFRSAVVSDAIKLRFIAAAIMLISKHHKSFTTREWQRAYEHLSLSVEERRGVEAAVSQMRVALSKSAPPEMAAQK